MADGPSADPGVPTLGAALDLDLGIDFDATDPLPSRTHVPLSPQAARTQPLARSQALQTAARRVLVVSADVQERAHLRACLALSRLVWVDEASTTTQARSALADHAHALVFINVDTPVIDSAQLLAEVRRLRPQALVLATTAGRGESPGHPWRWLRAAQWWWQRRAARQAGFHDLLHKPLRSGVVNTWARQVLQTYQKI
jgi:CheY-like chemotaxis protein